MKFSRLILGALAVLAITTLVIINNSKEVPGRIKIGICKAADHVALDQVVAGIIAKLERDKNIDIEIASCQGNTVIAEQLLSKLSEDCVVVITIGTMPSIVASNTARRKNYNCAKVVFSSVTNPDDIPNKDMVTGVSNFINLEPQIELFKKFQPALKRLGIIYNLAEQNSMAIVSKLEVICKKYGITLVPKCASTVQEIQQVTNSLIQDEVDAVFISNDNTALSSLPLITSLCKKFKIPVYVSDTDQVEPAGCLASLGPNQYEIGVQTGAIVDAIIKQGAKMPSIEYPKKQKTVINVSISEELDIKIPEDLLGRDGVILIGGAT
ncbi:MAG: ABC transporter substrate-binding protein [Holosporales bacterium]|jgi:putative ABC transport system substrate-binding protein|nr:ABC transporter substrate-binding protein [Holosporales bacterium]